MKTTPLGIIIAGASGRMGSLLVKMVLESPDFQLVGVTETEDRLEAFGNLPCVVSSSLKDILVAFPTASVIDFTAPAATMNNAEIIAKQKGTMVIGTTGLSAENQKVLVNFAKEARILWSANMSIGVNALLTFLPKIVQALGPEYDLEVMELHHKKKKDSPSGTALMLAKSLASSRGWQLDEVRKSGRDGMIGERPPKEIGIHALRGGDVVGIHSIWLLGPGETIEITHQAQSRENFANGALRAALWLSSQKPGKLYSIRDMV